MIHVVRRLWLAVIGALVLLPLLAACEGGDAALKSLTIDPAEVTMQSRGENIQLKAIGTRPDGTIVSEDTMDLRWTYSDGSIASCDKSGLLRGVLAGEGTVSVKSEKYNMTATIKVHVLPAKYTPQQMQAKVQQIIAAVAAMQVSAATTSDPENTQSMLKDVTRSLTEANKYIGQGTNNTLASVELLNAAQFMEIVAPKAKGTLAEALVQQVKLARQCREDLFAY
jgi:hypothetical protein